jgi:hypothetical protein
MDGEVDWSWSRAGWIFFVNAICQSPSLSELKVKLLFSKILYIFIIFYILNKAMKKPLFNAVCILCTCICNEEGTGI